MTMHELYFLILYFFVYAFLGWCTEVAFAAWKTHHFVNRGFLNGPICPVYGIGVGVVVQFLTPYRSNLILLYIASVVLVSAIEWLTGFLLEKLFHNKWWDYSDMPLNLNGYICLLFSLIWGAACVLIVQFIHPGIHRILAHLPMILGVILIVILGIAMFADLYITASGILKMNKRLEAMQEIADELHQISDRLGENIYKSTVFAMERQEELRETLSERHEEFEEFRDSLAEKHEEFRDSLAEKQEELRDSLAGKQEEFRDALTEKQEEFRNALTGKQEELRDALTEKHEEFQEALDEAFGDVSDEIREHIRERFIQRLL